MTKSYTTWLDLRKLLRALLGFPEDKSGVLYKGWKLRKQKVHGFLVGKPVVSYRFTYGSVICPNAKFKKFPKGTIS